MSKSKNAPNVTHVKIDFPDGNHINLDICEELTPMACIYGIKNQPLVFWYTNGHFETKSGPLLTSPDLSKDVVKSVLQLTYVEDEYNLESTLIHIQQIARIIFTSTSHPEVTDCSQSVISWMTRTYANGIKAPTEQDYVEYFPENFQKSSIPKLVKHFDIEEGSKPSNEGIFIKIKIITKENKEIIVNATKNGFSIDNDPSKNYSTIHLLLCNISEYFKENSQFAVARWISLNNVEKTPYCPLNRQHIYCDNRKKKFLPQLRLFNVNKEILTGSVQDAINKINGNSQNHSICINIEEQYMKQISKSVEKINDGKVQPETDGDGSGIVFIDNGVRITKINNIEEYRSFINYIKSIDDLRNISNKIKVERPIIVEYLGQIYVVKPSKGEDNFITKVTNQKNENNSESNDESIDFKKSFCDKFSCQDLPEGITGFIKDDDYQANCAILTFVSRTTPRDPNYPNDPLCLLRPEILRTYESYLELNKHSEELIKLGGDPNFNYMHNPSNNKNQKFTVEMQQALTTRRNEIILQAKSLLYDLNLTTEQLKNDKMMNEIGKFIKSTAIEIFINLFLTTVNCSVDGNFLVHKMHSFGLNVRYMADILKFMPIGTDDEKPMNKTYQMLIHCEMIIRSFKHIVRTNNYSFDVLLEMINSFIQFDSDSKFGPLFDNICSVSEKKFGIRPNKPTKEQIPYLKRGMMIVLGIVVTSTKGSKEYDLLKTENVTEVIPHVNFCFTKNNDYYNTFKQAVIAFNNNDIGSYELFQKVIRLSNNYVTQFDDTVIDSFFYCAIILFKANHHKAAYEMMLESAAIQERKVGFTDASLLFKYCMLGSFARQMRSYRLAFVIFARVFVLLKLISPFTPATIEIVADAADAASNFNPDIAYKFASFAIEETKQKLPEKERGPALSTAYATAASIAISLDKLQLAANYADEAIKLNSQNQDYINLRARINNLIVQKQSSKRGGSRARRRGGH